MSVHDAKSHSHKILVSAESSAVSNAPEETCCQWLGRKIVECFCCCCPKTAKVQPAPLPSDQLFRQISRLGKRSTTYQLDFQKAFEGYLRENPDQLSKPGLGLDKRPDITQQVMSLNLSDVNFDGATTGQFVAISRATKIENIARTFPNLTELNLSACGLGQPQRGKTHVHFALEQGRDERVEEDPATECLRSVAANCTKLVSLNLSKNVISNPSLLELKPLKSLRTLHLQSCRGTLSAEGIERLQSALPDLTIYHQPPRSARQRSGDQRLQLQVVSMET